MISGSSTIDLLDAARNGNDSARDKLVALVYDELRYLAQSYLQNERSNHTLQPTALVHESFLRLIEQHEVNWQNREHFMALAATMMRRVLVDYARSHRRGKRGGGEYKLSLAEAEHYLKDEDVNLEQLNEALEKLAKNFPQKSQVIELRFFGGLTIEETARVLKISESTVERDWKFARAWLLKEMSNE